MMKCASFCKLLPRLLLTAAVCMGLLLTQTPVAWAEGPVAIDIGGVSGGGTGFTYSGGVVTITAAGDYTVSGTTSSNTLSVAGSIVGPVNLTLDNVSMVNSKTSSLAIGSGSSVDLTLVGLSTLSSNTATSSYAGIHVPDTATLRISGTGRLDVTGRGTGAGIGSAGNITIESGTVNATGGYNDSGTGGSGIRGTVVINGGAVTAKGGLSPYAASGSGLAGTVTINAGVVVADAGSGAVGGAGIGGSGSETAGNITINGGTVTATGDKNSGQSGAGIGGGYGGSGGAVVINGGNVTAKGATGGAGIGGGYGGWGGSVTITNQNGDTVVTASGMNGGAGIGGGEGVNGNGGAGGTILISGGTVYADGATGLGGAGIGGGYTGSSGGQITISGGEVHATGGYNSAGIGGAESCSGGTINISGGQVTAQGGFQGAGIGCGYNRSTNGGVKGGQITITGGIVNATGGSNSAGIGGGFNASADIIQIGGTASVTAGGQGGAGIGGGANQSTSYDENANGGTIVIGGGTVTATGVNGGAGIGGGYMGNTGSIAINGGRVYATVNSASGGSAIGSGVNSADLVYAGTNVVTVNGGWVRTTGGTYDFGGGSTCFSRSATITFNGGSIDGNSAKSWPVSSAKSVYKTTITVANADQTLLTDADVTYQVNGGSSISTRTDDGGKLYLWLPTSGSATVQVFQGSVEYDATGAVTADNAAAMTAIEQTYEIEPIDDQAFVDLTEGYANGQQESKTIRITNSGTAALTNLSVSLGTGEEANFNLGALPATTLPPGASVDFTLGAKDGLAIGDYVANVTIRADKMDDVTFQATQTVRLIAVDFVDGGTPFDSRSVHYNAPVGEADWPSDPEKTGYDFVGWFANAGEQALPNTAFLQDATLTARWSVTQYTIGYDLGGGTVTSSNPTGYTIESDAITLVNPTKTGYQFAGWTGNDITEPSVAVTISSGSVGNLLFTANWTANTYTIAFDGNGGTGTTSSALYTYDEPKALTANGFTKPGYSFAGWARSQGGPVAYDDAETVQNLTEEDGATVTLWAHWTRVDYTISYDLNGGSVSPANPSGYNVESDDIVLRNPAKTGYAFAGWSGTGITGTATSVTIASGSTGNRTYEAHWNADVTVTFDSQGGSSVASKTAAYNTTISAPADPKRTGYSFGGWYKQAACTTAWNFSADKVTANITLYAKWTANKYTITATASNTAYGSVTGSGSYAYGTTATLKAIPKAGCRFVRWLEGSTAVSTSNPYRFTVGKARTLKAEFAKIGVPTVKAASAGYNSVKLTWAAVAGASGYEVYRATTKTGTYKLAGTASGTSYVNAGLATGTTYYYKVRAKCITGSTTTYGGYAAVVSAKPVPAVPASVKAVSASYSSVKLTWSAVSGASGYEVYRATSSGGTYTKLTTTTAASYTTTGQTTGKTYYYKVRAYRTVSGTKVYGGYSAAISAKALPGTPGGVKAARASNSSVKVSWDKVSGASGYEVYRATSKTGTYAKVGSVTNGATVSYTNKGLTDNKLYYYKVRAYRAVGSAKVYGAFSAIVSATP